MLKPARGTDYVAIVRITDRPGNVLAAVGQTCARVPVDVLESLERRGKIRRASGVVSRTRPFMVADADPEHVAITPADSPPGQEEG